VWIEGFPSSTARVPSAGVIGRIKEGRGKSGLHPRVKSPALVLGYGVPRVPLIVLQGHGPFQAQPEEAITNLGYLGGMVRGSCCSIMGAWD
jgi:hypothetical protein